jgi:chromosome segregation ATPase
MLQGQLHASLAQHSTLGQELAAAQLQADRAEREGRAESSRLEAEVSALRERLDRADSETLRARQEALRLSEQLAALDREVVPKPTPSKSQAQLSQLIWFQLRYNA